MKYSPDKQDIHLEIIYPIVEANPGISIRELCRQLEKQNLHLSRPYASKLLWQAYQRFTSDKRDRMCKKPELVAWFQELDTFIDELDRARAKIKDHLWKFPIRGER